MRPDPGIEPVRAARRRISQEFSDDPAKVVEHYIELQKQFGPRLLSGSGSQGYSEEEQLSAEPDVHLAAARVPGDKHEAIRPAAR